MVINVHWAKKFWNGDHVLKDRVCVGPLQGGLTTCRGSREIIRSRRHKIGCYKKRWGRPMSRSQDVFRLTLWWWWSLQNIYPIYLLGKIWENLMLHIKFEDETYLLLYNGIIYELTYLVLKFLKVCEHYTVNYLEQ